MTTSLCVRLPRRPIQSPGRWSAGTLASVPSALVREEGAQGPQYVQREGMSRTDELPATDRLILLLPAADVLLVSANVPPLVLPKLRLTLPNLVEEHLVQDAQQYHIAPGPRLGDTPARNWHAPHESQSRALMIVNRAWVRFILGTFADHKHRICHLLPTQLCVPFETPAVTAAPHAESTNAGERAELSLDATDASAPTVEAPAVEAVATVVPAAIALDAAPPSGPDAPVTIDIAVRTDRAEDYDLRVLSANVGNWLGIAPTPATLMVSPTLHGLAPSLSADPTTAALDWSTWAAGARDALVSDETDLCQFGLARGGVAGMDWGLWRLPITLAVLLVIVQLIGMNARWLTLRAEQKRLGTIIRAQSQTAFPNAPVVLNPPAQMRRRVGQLRLAAGKSTPEDFLPLADRFTQAVTDFAPDALLTLDYHGRILTVTLEDGTDTASLRTAARNVGLNVDAAEAPRRTGVTVPGSRWTVSIAQQ